LEILEKTLCAANAEHREMTHSDKLQFPGEINHVGFAVYIVTTQIFIQIILT
jgi:hypothetical protein